MKTNDNIPADARDEVIELGVVSVETQGMAGITENFGVLPEDGISDA